MGLRVWHSRAWHTAGAECTAAVQRAHLQPCRVAVATSVVPVIHWEGKAWNSTPVIAAETGGTRGLDNVRIRLLKAWMIKLIATNNNSNIMCQIQFKILRICRN